MIVDRKSDSLIICDSGNERVVQWPLQNGIRGKTIISDIPCWSLAMDNNGDLYISNYRRIEVRRWKMGERKGTFVASRTSDGQRYFLFSVPLYIHVDAYQSVYVSHTTAHRIERWIDGANEGILKNIRVGERGYTQQLYYPHGVAVDDLENVCVADSTYH